MRMHQVVASIVTLALSASIAFAGGGTAFTYQGRLLDAGEPANGDVNLEFSLWDALSGPNQVGLTQILNGVPIADGLFTVQIDFGAEAFDNADRWLEVTVNAVLLSPRQPITRAPYSIQTRGIFVTENQLVGIGTSNPLERLHVANGSLLVDAGISGGFAEFTGSVHAGDNAIHLHTNGDIQLDGGINAVGELFTAGNVTAQGAGWFGEEVTVNSGRLFVRDNVGIGTTQLFDFVKLVVDDDGLDWAAWFMGDVRVEGTLVKNGGGFKVDHPLDPSNKYLSHSFVESPDMMNVYNGNVTTDEAGFATVQLPDYFQALNRDFRYQLTVIGQFAQAIVAEEITDNWFVIRSDKPRVKVSWQVTGIRQDAWAEANRIEIEQWKEPENRGKYFTPKVVGQHVD